ncbi:uncharacterized protein LOC118734042 [Rhagoletis pomonella]|uniref:uncharacterized protein LOC118734042 n=1 Tax=Rhagoletis pomonella TaxID=28610 RepID=UPI00177EFBBC|nr:uncharacterized protein LOC118734042 [Rhagoletis pomonella]
MKIVFFNAIGTFHVTENYAFDIMHDLFEGVCVYDICNIILSLLNSNYFTLEELNSRKTLFPYWETEIANTSPSLELNKLKSMRLKMTARECLTFLHFLPLMIGDKVPRDSDHWKLCLRIEIVDFVLKPSFKIQGDIEHLEKLIRDHHSLYISLFGETLKPKHHFMTHYPSALRMCGPLKKIWCFRFEAKHRQSKMYSKSITSRLNPPWSLATKASLKFSEFLIKYSEGLPIDYELKTFTVLNLRSLPCYDSIVDSDAPQGNFRETNEVKYRGNQIYVLCYFIEINLFDKHFQAFEIGKKT